MLRIRNTTMRIRIPLLTLMRIWIHLLTLMRIWIHLLTLMRIRIYLFTLLRFRILLLIKVMQIYDHWSTDPRKLYLATPQPSISPFFSLWPLTFMRVRIQLPTLIRIHADPDPQHRFNEDDLI